MATTHRGVGNGSMFAPNTSVKKSIDDHGEYDRELADLKKQENEIEVEIEKLTQELPERRKIFDELLKKRAIIDDAIKKLEMQLMIERVNLKTEEQE